ncbi:MAG: FHA domain-containing protein [Methyloprofundus sp.]|nr:FHA domain-containing protein [Methyloprofundus sp.]
MKKKTSKQKKQDSFWQEHFFPTQDSKQWVRRSPPEINSVKPTSVPEHGDVWLQDLFTETPAIDHSIDKLTIYKEGHIIYEIDLDKLQKETLIGRHPDVDIQLESYKLSMYHAVILKKRKQFYIKNLDVNNGLLLQRKKILSQKPIHLYDGAQIDLPSYRLEFVISNAPAPKKTKPSDTATIAADIPDFFYSPPPPETSPLLSELIQHQSKLNVWEQGNIQLKVADIIQETHDCKTFRFICEQSCLFAYKPGQFITFLLNIKGQQIKRAYSMSSSPSRPYVLEVTIKRVRGGIVSNWFFNEVKLGDILSAKGPLGKFTCFNFPAHKMLFIGAGSGITPILSMSRWITDTASTVDIKLLASFKTPADIIFRKELEALAARSSGFQIALTMTGDCNGTEYWAGFRGRINQAMLNIFVADLYERDVFVCGPDSLAKHIEEILRSIDYDMSRFHKESFGSARSAQNSKTASNSLNLKGKIHTVHFTKSKLKVKTDEYTPLLELAEAHGIEVDYSCRSGSCGECEMKCKGKVKINEACEIDKKTRQAGFVYSCCTSALADLKLDI